MITAREIAERREGARRVVPLFVDLPKEIKPCACGMPHNSVRFGQCVFCDGQMYNPRPAI